MADYLPHFSPVTWYYVWATLLVLVNAAALVATLFTLPGNWIIVLATALFAWLVPYPEGGGVGWWCVVVILVLAIIGEILEFIAGAAGAAKQGGSRRGMLLAMAGAMAGSLAGSIGGSFIPIPLIGTVMGALGGGAAGAFGGAYLGEKWKGRSEEQSVAVSKAAMTGRLLGTAAKLAVGVAMLAITTVAAYWN